MKNILTTDFTLSVKVLRTINKKGNFHGDCIKF